MNKKLLLFTLSCLCAATAVLAKPGIKSIVVFGDSLSDTGNSIIWSQRWDDFTTPDFVTDPTQIPVFPPPYYQFTASNGPSWIQIVASAYGYRVDPAMQGGMNFAFAGAESGGGLSDQFTPNFHTQIRLYRMALERELIAEPMPWQLFVVWFGPNDVLRAVVEEQVRAQTAGEAPDFGALIDPLTTDIATNISQGIVKLHENGARMFLVPNMPALELTPVVSSTDYSPLAQLAPFFAAVNAAFNAKLEQALAQIENTYDRVTILRIDTDGVFREVIDNPDDYGLTNVTEPYLPLNPATGRPDYNLETGELNWPDGEIPSPEGYLSWDGFHPTIEGHLLLAQYAMEIIPIGSWWGKSMARGPMGNVWTGMGWMNDTHWPWLFSYSMDENGIWMWAYEEGGDIDGFYAYLPRGYKWVFMNARSGWYYDYEAGKWMRIEP